MPLMPDLAVVVLVVVVLAAEDSVEEDLVAAVLEAEDSVEEGLVAEDSAVVASGAEPSGEAMEEASSEVEA
jgi:hypothetical protein